jgi:hypothetical protein
MAEAKRRAEISRKAAVDAEHAKIARRKAEIDEAARLARMQLEDLERREKARTDALEERKKRIQRIAGSIGKDLGDKQRLEAQAEAEKHVAARVETDKIGGEECTNPNFVYL